MRLNLLVLQIVASDVAKRKIINLGTLGKQKQNQAEAETVEEK